MIRAASWLTKQLQLGVGGGFALAWAIMAYRENAAYSTIAQRESIDLTRSLTRDVTVWILSHQHLLDDATLLLSVALVVAVVGYMNLKAEKAIRAWKRFGPRGRVAIVTGGILMIGYHIALAQGWLNRSLREGMAALLGVDAAAGPASEPGVAMMGGGAPGNGIELVTLAADVVVIAL